MKKIYTSTAFLVLYVLGNCVSGIYTNENIEIRLKKDGQIIYRFIGPMFDENYKGIWHHSNDTIYVNISSPCEKKPTFVESKYNETIKGSKIICKHVSPCSQPSCCINDFKINDSVVLSFLPESDCIMLDYDVNKIEVMHVFDEFEDTIIYIGSNSNYFTIQIADNAVMQTVTYSQIYKKFLFKGDTIFPIDSNNYVIKNMPLARVSN